MSDTQASTNAPEQGVSRHTTETIVVDHEKIIAAMGPLVQQFAPIVQAWTAKEVKKVEVQEIQATRRQWVSSASMVALVMVVAFLAWTSITQGQAATGEKIVIGLLAFLGGLGARR